MAQSGLPTAVGMAPESSWGNAPLTLVSGANYSLGAAGTNPHRFWTVEPGGGFPIRPTIEVPKDELDGDIQLLRAILTQKNYDGDFAWKCDAENLFYPLLGVFGKDVQTVVNGGTSGTFTTGVGANQLVITHTFTPNLYAPSYMVEEAFGDKRYGRLSTGSVIPSLTLDFGAIMTARMGLYAKSQIPNRYPVAGTDTDFDFTSTYAVLPTQLGGDGTKMVKVTQNPTFVDVAEANNGNGPFVWAGAGFGSQLATSYFSIDGVAQTNALVLPGIQVVLGRDIDRHMIAGSGYEIGACTGNAFGVGGSMQVLFTDNSIPLAVLRKSKISVNIKFTGVVIGATTQKYAIEVYLPWVNFLEGGVSVPASAMQAGGNFVARKDPTLGYACQIKLTNTVNAYTLLGGAGTTGAANGLGGHNIS